MRQYLWRRVPPPRWLFHVPAGVCAGAVLVATSYPGLDVLTLLWAVPSLLVLAGLWVVWLLAFLVVRIRNGDRRWSWWFLVAPVGAVLAVGLVVAEVPLHLRWAASRSSFDAVVAGLPAPPARSAAPTPEDEPADLTPAPTLPESVRNLPIGPSLAGDGEDDDSNDDSEPGWTSVDVPGRIGGYLITGADLVPGGVVFWEVTGDLGDDAGFAYLPEGPYPELENGSFERPQFRHLGGPWYAWTASW